VSVGRWNVFSAWLARLGGEGAPVFYNAVQCWSFRQPIDRRRRRRRIGGRATGGRDGGGAGGKWGGVSYRAVCLMARMSGIPLRTLPPGERLRWRACPRGTCETGSFDDAGEAAVRPHLFFSRTLPRGLAIRAWLIQHWVARNVAVRLVLRRMGTAAEVCAQRSPPPPTSGQRHCSRRTSILRGRAKRRKSRREERSSFAGPAGPTIRFIAEARKVERRAWYNDDIPVPFAAESLNEAGGRRWLPHSAGNRVGPHRWRR